MAQKQSNETTSGTTEIIDQAVSCAASQVQTTPTLQLRLEHPQDERRVVFHAGVIDNENLNRKKSKCKPYLRSRCVSLITFHFRLLHIQKTSGVRRELFG